MTILERPTEGLTFIINFIRFFLSWRRFLNFPLILFYQMRYVAAALLSALGGSDISEAGIKTILDSVGIEYDAEKAKKVIKSLFSYSWSVNSTDASSKYASYHLKLVTG